MFICWTRRTGRSPRGLLTHNDESLRLLRKRERRYRRLLCRMRHCLQGTASARGDKPSFTIGSAPTRTKRVVGDRHSARVSRCPSCLCHSCSWRHQPESSRQLFCDLLQECQTHGDADNFSSNSGCRWDRDDPRSSNLGSPRAQRYQRNWCSLGPRALDEHIKGNTSWFVCSSLLLHNEQLYGRRHAAQTQP